MAACPLLNGTMKTTSDAGRAQSLIASQARHPSNEKALQLKPYKVDSELKKADDEQRCSMPFYMGVGCSSDPQVAAKSLIRYWAARR
jgi:hypothetical protein